MRYTLVILMVVFFQVGCATSTNTSKSTKPERQKEVFIKEKNEIDNAKIIYLNPPTFSDSGITKVVKDECHMLPIVKTSIEKSFLDYGYKIIYLDEPAPKEDKRRILSVVFTQVEANRMSGLSFRPGSIGYFKLSMADGGVVINEVNNRIGSKTAFTACERLDKIAKATGRYAAKWASKFSF